jgi:hypothetical protein
MSITLGDLIVMASGSSAGSGCEALDERSDDSATTQQHVTLRCRV